jgi:hypothetical protein
MNMGTIITRPLNALLHRKVERLRWSDGSDAGYRRQQVPERARAGKGQV